MLAAAGSAFGWVAGWKHLSVAVTLCPLGCRYQPSGYETRVTDSCSTQTASVRQCVGHCAKHCAAMHLQPGTQAVCWLHCMNFTHVGRAATRMLSLKKGVNLTDRYCCDQHWVTEWRSLLYPCRRNTSDTNAEPAFNASKALPPCFVSKHKTQCSQSPSSPSKSSMTSHATKPQPPTLCRLVHCSTLLPAAPAASPATHTSAPPA